MKKNTTNKETIKQYYKKIIPTHNNLPKHPQNEYITERTITQKKYPYTTRTHNITITIKLPLIKLKRGHCPECNNTTYSTDYHRGEKVCNKCGLVISDNMTNYTPSVYTQKQYYQDAYKPDEKKYFQQRKRRHLTPQTPKKIWVKHNNILHIETLCQQAQLNTTQTALVKHIILCNGYKKLHSRYDKTVITLAVIRYVQKQAVSSTQNNRLRYDREPYKDNLLPEVYKKIEENIIKNMKNY